MAKDYQALYEACKQQAQIWKQEARCANHTIGQIYQLVTGSKGEPGNWNGAEPAVKALIAERDALREALEHARVRFECLAEDFKDDENNVNWAMCSVDAERMIKALTVPSNPQ